MIFPFNESKNKKKKNVHIIIIHQMWETQVVYCYCHLVFKLTLNEKLINGPFVYSHIHSCKTNDGKYMKALHFFL